LDKQRITSSDPEFHVFFRTYKKIYKKILTLAKKKQHNDFIQSAANKTKAAWQIVNSDLGRQKNSKTEISCLVNPQTGENSNISQEIANILNCYYRDISKNTNPVGPKDSNFTIKQPNFINNSIYLSEVTEADILEAAKKLKTKNCSGFDEISKYLGQVFRKF